MVRRASGRIQRGNRIAGPCQKVADDILEGFKRLDQSPTLVTFTTNMKDGNAARIGFDLGAGQVVQVSVSGYHVAVRCGERIYDAFTGPTGMLIADYMARLTPGMQSFPVVMK